MKNTKVMIFVGSQTDLSTLEGAEIILKDFEVPYEFHITSAHRSLDKTLAHIREGLVSGVEVFLVGAGGAAHLAGVVASQTIVPVIGIPMGSQLDGLDSLLSTAQMPKGIPVATVAVGSAGAANAALLAVQILALQDRRMREKLIRYKAELTEKVIEHDNALQKRMKTAPGSKKTNVTKSSRTQKRI